MRAGSSIGSWWFDAATPRIEAESFEKSKSHRFHVSALKSKKFFAAFFQKRCFSFPLESMVFNFLAHIMKFLRKVARDR